MTLREAIERLDEWERSDLICCRRPWTAASECVVVAAEEHAVPREVAASGFKYFLEVSTAREIIEEKRFTPEQTVSLLIFYAENDAFPDWYYSP